MENYNKKAEELLLELAQQEENNNKKLLFSMYVILGVSVTFYFLIIFIAGFFMPEGMARLIVILVSTLVFIIAGFIIWTILVQKVDVHHKFIPGYKEVLWAMHMGTTRYLKCPKCGKKSWSKKVMKK